MKDGDFQIGPSSKEELKADLKDMLIKLWWLWAPPLIIGIIILLKFRSRFLAIID